MFLYEFSVAVYDTAVSATSAPSVISQGEMPPFSGENGNLSTSAILLSLRDISLKKGITFCHFVTFPLTGDFP